MSVSEILGRFMGFVGVIYLARTLDVAGFGKINFGLAIIAYFALIGNFGLNTLGTRDIAGSKSNRHSQYISSMLTLKIVLACAAFLILLVFAVFLPKQHDVKLMLVYYGFSLLPLIVWSEWIFQGIELMQYTAAAHLLLRSGYLVCILIFVKNPGDMLRVPLCWFAANTAGSILLLLIYVRKFGGFHLDFDTKAWKKLTVAAVPLGLSFIMVQIYGNLDTLILGFMRSDAEVGWYNAAYKIILFIFILGGNYQKALFPVLSRYYKTSLEKFTRILSYSVKMMLIAGLPLGVGGVLLGRGIIELFYGPQYLNSVVALQILIWQIVVSFSCMMYANSLIACGKDKSYAYGVSIAAVSNLLLNVILIPYFGIKGAAIATVAAECILFVYAYNVFRKIAKIEFFRHVPKPALCSLFMGGVLYYARNMHVLTAMVIGIVAYISAVFLSGCISKEEFRFIKNHMFVENST